MQRKGWTTGSTSSAGGGRGLRLFIYKKILKKIKKKIPQKIRTLDSHKVNSSRTEESPQLLTVFGLYDSSSAGYICEARCLKIKSCRQLSEDKRTNNIAALPHRNTLYGKSVLTFWWWMKYDNYSVSHPRIRGQRQSGI